MKCSTSRLAGWGTLGISGGAALHSSEKSWSEKRIQMHAEVDHSQDLVQLEEPVVVDLSPAVGKLADDDDSDVDAS